MLQTTQEPGKTVRLPAAEICSSRRKITVSFVHGWENHSPGMQAAVNEKVQLVPTTVPTHLSLIGQIGPVPKSRKIAHLIFHTGTIQPQVHYCQIFIA